MTRNRLVDETSPYLLQHRDNPVHWQPWGTEALEQAQREGRPILLSIGYSSCHWCHVMAHESFEDENTARVMNDLFVNIKVDREERPDLDVIYQSALALMGERGGWPLTMFLTPDGKPFWGGTYFPPEARYGRPGFKDLLVGLHDAWTNQRAKVLSNVSVISDALAALARPQSGGAFTMETLDRVCESTLRLMDPIHGGFRGAPKFPQVPYLHLLWRAWRRTGSGLYYDAVVTAVERMAQGGIYDHIGGGFARYATDDEWLVPHFEKMLYDNAQLISLMCAVYGETGSALLARRIRETVAWMIGEMKVEDVVGYGFASALDADSIDADGRLSEGAYFVWREDQIDAALGEASPIFKSHYGVTTVGNWHEGGHGVNVLSRKTACPAEPAVEKMLEDCLGKLKTLRALRARPGRDGKVLADLNGLAIRALVDAANALDEKFWLGAAEMVFDFICRNLTREGRLLRSWTSDEAGRGRPRHKAVLDDVAQMSRAALALFESTGEPAYLAQCESWVAQADDLFWCDRDGGYCLSARDASDVITRSRLSADNALPNGNGTMTEVLGRLYFLTGDDGYRARANALLSSFPAESADAVANMPTMLSAFELLQNAVQVVVAGGGKAAQALIRTALAHPDGLVVVVHGDEDMPPGHPAFGKTAPQGQALAYVCRNGACQEPVADVQGLRRALETR